MHASTDSRSAQNPSPLRTTTGPLTGARDVMRMAPPPSAVLGPRALLEHRHRLGSRARALRRTPSSRSIGSARPRSNALICRWARAALRSAGQAWAALQAASSASSSSSQALRATLRRLKDSPCSARSARARCCTQTRRPSASSSRASSRSSSPRSSCRAAGATDETSSHHRPRQANRMGLRVVGSAATRTSAAAARCAGQRRRLTASVSTSTSQSADHRAACWPS